MIPTAVGTLTPATGSSASGLGLGEAFALGDGEAFGVGDAFGVGVVTPPPAPGVGVGLAAAGGVGEGVGVAVAALTEKPSSNGLSVRTSPPCETVRLIRSFGPQSIQPLTGLVALSVLLSTSGLPEQDPSVWSLATTAI